MSRPAPGGRGCRGCAERLELVGGRRAIRVRGDEERPATQLHDVSRQLGRRGRLARALEADHGHDRRVARQVERPVAGRQQRDQLVVDDLDHLLAGRQAVEHLVPIARSRTRATKSLTTLKLTSASSSARRTSRMAASTSASLIRPRPVRLPSVLRSRSLRVSNMVRVRTPGGVTGRAGAGRYRVVREF